MSSLQQRLWFIDQLQPGDVTYNMSVTTRVRGFLDLEVLQSALDAVVDRHGALRTRFLEVGGEPVQEVLPDVRVRVDVVDMRGRVNAEEAGLACAAEETRQPFDLSVAPLMRCQVVRLGDEDQLLVFTIHHIVFDGWSAGVFIDDLMRAFADGPAGLGGPVAQFTELVEWERVSVDQGEQDRLVAWWKERLEGAPTVLDLVTDRPRPAVQAHRGARRQVTVDPDVVEALEALGRVYGVTSFMTLLAAFGVVMTRHAGQDEVLIGAPVAARPHARFDRSVGCFLNTVTMRVDVGGEPTFAELLAKVKETTLQAFDHQQVPFERLVAELAPEHDLSRNPLCQVFVNAEPEPSALTLPGCTSERIPTETVSAKFDLTLYIKSQPGSMQLELVYDADLFEDAIATEILDQTRVLLSQLSKNPHRPVRAYSLVTSRGRETLPDPLEPIKQTWPGSVLDRLAERVESAPASIAMSTPDRDWTYAELDLASNRLGRRLAEAGVGRGDVVGLFTTRDPSTMVAMFAALKIGAPFVTMDSTMPAARLEQCLTVSRPRALLVGGGAEALSEDIVLAVAGSTPVIRLDDPEWTTRSATALGIRLGPDDPVYAVFTSGTTGVPKCVVTTHGVLSHFFDWYAGAQRLGPDDRFAVLSGLGYEPLMRDTLMAVWAGARSCFPEHDRLDFEGIANWLRDTGITVAHITPPYAEELAVTVDGRLQLPDMRLVGSGGDVLRRSTAAAWAVLAPGASLLNYYGTTETPQAISVLSLRDTDTTDGIRAFGTKLPIGPGIDGVQLLCVNPAGELCGVREIGELVVRTPYLARYIGKERGGFITSPWSGDPGDRVYRTGDRVRWLGDGCLEFVGRVDHQVNLRGFRIEPGEVEAVLLRHPSVRLALVMVREDRTGDPRLVAYVTSAVGSAVPSAEELRTLVSGTLPKHMVPSAFMVLDSFPLTVNGKVDRPVLPAPSRDSYSTSRAVVSVLERELAALWEATLGIEGVGAEDNFFELGGHSLLLTRLLARIRETHGVVLALRDVFERPTVAGFAVLVEAALKKTASTDSTGPAQQQSPRRAPDGDGLYGLSSMQRRMWFLNQVRPGDVAYNMSAVSRVRGFLDLEVLQSALDAVVDRHGALRTRFLEVGGEPVQEVLPDVRVRVDVVDMRGRVNAEEAGLACAAEETRQPFDLSVAPLMRCQVVRLGDEDQLLVFTIHHIVFDGWSAGVFIDDLMRAFADGPAGLGGPVAQFTELVEWERVSVDQGEQDRLVAWWKERLEGAPTVLDLVTDRPRPAVQAHRGARRQVTVPVGVVEDLEALGRKHGTTLFMTLLAAFGVVLSRHAGQDEVLIGTPVASRPCSEFERSVGCFLNTVLMRVDAGGEPTFGELLARVRDMTLDAFDHQQVPFERLVAELAPDHDLSRNPLYQVLFALQNTPKAHLRIPGWTVESLQSTEAHVQSDLCLRLTRDDQGLNGGLDYDLDLFDEATVDRLVEHLTNALVAVAKDPHITVNRLALVGEAEENLLDRWNDTAAPWRLDRTLPELLAEQVHRTPHAVAVRCDDAELTYEELDHRANRLALRLRELGVVPDVVVGIHLRRSTDLVVALVSVLKAGGAYMPLEPDYPVGRLRAMVEDSAARVVITTAEGSGTFESDTCVEVLVDMEAAEVGPEPLADPAHPAYVIYTSGSTGAPKGVQIPHRGIVNRLLWMQDTYGLTSRDRVLQKTPISFDVSVWELFWPLITGAVLVMAAARRHRDPDYLVEVMAKEKVTVCHFVPPMLSAFLDDPGAGTLDDLRLIVCSGEALPPDVAQRCLNTVNARLENLYGPTEASVDVTSWTCRTGSDPVRVPIGRPIANTRAYVLNSVLAPTPVAVVGELYLGGVGLARGYVGRAGLTAERFVADPYGPPGSRLYRTGDRARWLPDGSLEFLGRLDHQVKLRGFRIEPGEVEAVLLRHPSVSQSLVMVREDRVGDRRLVAYAVVTARAAAPTGEQLRVLAGDFLPGHMVPSAIVVLDSFPLTANGKIDRAALPAPAREKAAGSRSPETSAERQLAALWEEVLGIGGVGADDNFFGLGGDSMHAVALVGRARDRGFHLTVEALFRRPTVASLAEECGEPDMRRAAAEPRAEAQIEQFALMSEEDRVRLGLG
ncbi:amino acid adenylation domain-containing protein [Streptomyces halstedii]|uniref:amino acid adenylation domain-containing protein n=1 Tax=Streptomyces halstedii TaxID=1944 RepID=UPI0038079BDB